jgi:hypothetical protein
LVGISEKSILKFANIPIITKNLFGKYVYYNVGPFVTKSYFWN